MKKSIYLTIGSVLFTSSVVAAGVLLPTVTSVSSSFAFNLYNFSTNNDAKLYFNKNDFQAINENYKNLIIGNSNINNGTYILYIGSQGYQTNNNFLYGSQQNNVNSTVSEVNQQPELLGDFGVGLKFFEKLENQPKVLLLQDELTYADYQDKEEYENLVQEYKNIDLSSGDYDSESEEVKKKNWADKAGPFNSAPGATYTTWDGKTEYFRKTNKFPIFFNEVVSFVKANFNNLSDISTSDGILIGYKNGKICSDFSGSFTSSSGSTEENPATKSLFFQSFSTKQQATNNFTNWLSDNYGLKQ